MRKHLSKTPPKDSGLVSAYVVYLGKTYQRDYYLLLVLYVCRVIIHSNKYTKGCVLMNESFNHQARLCSLFNALEGIDLPIEDFDLPVRIYNSMKRSGIHNLQQLLAMSYDNIMSTLYGNANRRSETCDYIIYTLNNFNTNGIPKWDTPAAEDEGEIELRIGEVRINGVLIEESEN